MTVDDLTTPLGQRPAQRRREFPVSVPRVIAVALALFLGAFVAWAVVSDDPFGGEPKVAVPIDQRGLAAANKPDLATTIFLVIRGFAFSQQLLDSMAYDTVAPKQDRGQRHRRLLTEILSPYVEIASETDR